MGKINSAADDTVDEGRKQQIAADFLLLKDDGLSRDEAARQVATGYGVDVGDVLRWNDKYNGSLR